MVHLLIAGHGKRRDGSFDSGATGHITKGEHRYMSEDLFPAMKKFLPKDHNLIFFDEYNVFDRGNIVALAKQYNADQVTEFHFDATGSASASGGHVIIYDGYEPDKMDLALRDAIDDMVGIRYNHRGHKGISGRSNLGNVNRTANANVTYRLLELGFGTNKEDARIMTEEVEAYAKRLVEAITGTSNDVKPKPTKPKEKTQSKPTGGLYEGNSVVDYLNSIGEDSSYANRRILATKHGIRNYRGTSSQNTELLNKLRGSKSTSSKGKSIAEMAQEVIDGKHGDGHENRRKSLGISQSEYEKVRAEVNKRLTGARPSPISTMPRKSISQMAQEIIDGRHGNGHENRRKSLGISQSDYEKVRAEVNRRL